jgi:hypothetical protein
MSPPAKAELAVKEGTLNPAPTNISAPAHTSTRQLGGCLEGKPAEQRGAACHAQNATASSSCKSLILMLK